MSAAQPTFETAITTLTESTRRADRARSRSRRSWLAELLFAPFEDIDDRVRVKRR